MDNLSPFARKFVALLLAALLLAICAASVFVPLAISSKLEDQLVELDRNVEDLQSKLLVRENTLAEKRLLERNSRTEVAAIASETPGLAGALLQESLRDLFDSQGASVSGTQILEPIVDGEFYKIRVRTSFESGIQQLQQILFQIETSLPSMTIENMAVSRTDTSLESDLTQPLDISLMVSGFMRANSPEQSN